MTETVVRARRAYRDPEDRFLGGVASGLAAHLGIAPLHARVGFVLLTVMGGFGVIVYAALWILLPVVDRDPIDSGAPGLDAASRRGLRSSRKGRSASDMGVALSLAIVGLGAVVLLHVSGLWASPQVFWPLLVASAGIALLWWQSDERARTDWLSPYSGWKSWLRILVGAGLLAAAVSLALFQAGVPGALGEALGALALAVAGVGLVIGPWLLRLTRELRRERAGRVRSQERADVAAHLHDSVLQTLALIQRQAGDAATVSQLARTQERELRRWLFETDTAAADTLRSALQQTISDVEAAHQVAVELVTVGDAGLDESMQALAAASREAIFNAVRHSGASQVDVYVEVAGDHVEVFVRDRGCGFVLADVADDRLGVRRSIIDRVARHGGTAEVRSGDGSGTEVHLRMPARTTRGQQP